MCACAVMAPAIASAQNREQQQLFSELRVLQEQTQQLALAINKLNETLAALSKTTTAKLDEQANATRKGFADSKLAVDQMADNGRVLREKVDDTNVRISSIGQDVQSLQRNLNALQAVVAPLAALIPTAPTDPQAGAAAAPAPAAAAGAPGVSADRTYRMAYADYLSGNYDIAIDGFRGYLRTCPTCTNAADAQFYIGDSQFARGNNQDAIASYSLVITNYKGSAREPEAYYKRGVSYENLKPADKEKAKADFQYIIKNFPDSNMKPLAQDGLLRVSRLGF
jgi:tol-pal system protein YbgF